ncbi:hypothetical protein T12_3251 [Trichinella patagoniensis]|uniref:Uncharacterized protein n=1 Tax=Trichinella patagoniensis TaxID=990121 RepID=A0A0V0ZM60_9BILA|nr:hypothetical protein T12_3251 [Trichinella patagoniensis]
MQAVLYNVKGCEKFLATPKKKRGKVKPDGGEFAILFRDESFQICSLCAMPMHVSAVQCSAVLPFNKYHHPSSTPTRAELVEKQPRTHVYLEEAIDHFSTNYDHRANSTTDNNSNMRYDYEYPLDGSTVTKNSYSELQSRPKKGYLDHKLVKKATLKQENRTPGKLICMPSRNVEIDLPLTDASLLV